MTLNIRIYSILFYSLPYGLMVIILVLMSYKYIDSTNVCRKLLLVGYSEIFYIVYFLIISGLLTRVGRRGFILERFRILLKN